MLYILHAPFCTYFDIKMGKRGLLLSQKYDLVFKKFKWCHNVFFHVYRVQELKIHYQFSIHMLKKSYFEKNILHEKLDWYRKYMVSGKSKKPWKLLILSHKVLGGKNLAISSKSNFFLFSYNLAKRIISKVIILTKFYEDT